MFFEIFKTPFCRQCSFKVARYEVLNEIFLVRSHHLDPLIEMASLYFNIDNICRIFGFYCIDQENPNFVCYSVK